MPLPTTGTMTWAMIQTEFGGVNPIGINEYYRGGTLVPNTTANAAIPLSGQISANQFYGGSKVVNHTTSISPPGVNFSSPNGFVDIGFEAINEGGSGTFTYSWTMTGLGVLINAGSKVVTLRVDGNDVIRSGTISVTVTDSATNWAQSATANWEVLFGNVIPP